MESRLGCGGLKLGLVDSARHAWRLLCSCHHRGLLVVRLASTSTQHPGQAGSAHAALVAGRHTARAHGSALPTALGLGLGHPGHIVPRACVLRKRGLAWWPPAALTRPLPACTGGFTTFLQFQKWLEETYGTVTFQTLGADPRLRVADPVAAHEVLARHSTLFAKPSLVSNLLRPLLGNGLVTSEGEVHRVMRALLQPVFTMSSLATMRHRMALIALEGVTAILATTEAAEPPGQVDIHQAMGDITLSVVCAVTMGLDTAVDVLPAITTAGSSLSPEAAKAVLPPETSATKAKRLIYTGITEFTDKLLEDARWVLPLFIPDFVNRVPTPSNLAVRKRLREVTALTSSIIQRKMAARKRGDPPPTSPDLCDRLVDAMLDPNAAPDVKRVCTLPQVQSEVQTFVFAGHDTTSNLISWAMWCLQQHPQWLQRLRKELDAVCAQAGVGHTSTDAELAAVLGDLAGEGGRMAPVLEATLRETLRLLPSVPRVGRKTKQNTTIKVSASALPSCSRTPDKDGNITLDVPAGVSVAVDIMALHRHPLWGPDRHSFNPGRFLSPEGAYTPERIPGLAWAPFVAGNRKCIGYNLALMEARTILAACVLRMDWRVAQGFDARGVMAIVLRPAHGLPMHVSRREE